MNQDDFKSNPALWFCQEVLGSCAVSLRLVAESRALKEKLLGMNGKGDKFSVVKLLPESGPLEDRLRSAAGLNEKGYAVYYLPSSFKPGYEETYSQICEFRACVVDLDGAPYEDCVTFECAPTCVVESSAGKYQVVWKLAAGDICNNVTNTSCDEFNEISAQLGALFNGDLNACRATQPFRLPGFKHWKKEEPYLSWIKWIGKSTAGVSLSALKEALKRRKDDVRARVQARKTMRGETGAVDLSQGVAHSAAVDLEALRLGEVRVGPGDRHPTLQRFCVKLAFEDKDDDEIRRAVRAVIGRDFDDAVDFLEGGKRATEVEHCIEYARKQYNESKSNGGTAQDENEIATNRKRSKQPHALDTTYDFNSGTLKSSKYTETAMTERCLQKFYDDICNVDSRVLCFNNTEKLWVLQCNEGCREIKARLLVCVEDAINEADYKNLFCLCGKKMEFSEKLWATQQAQLKRACAVAGMCKAVMNHIAVRKMKFSDFDAAPDTVFLENGVFDMNGNVVRQAEATDYLLNKSPVKWEGIEKSNGGCSGWLKFIGEVFAENEEPLEMVRFIQELFGYSLSGYMSEEKIFCHWGNGCNGKSKVLQALKHLAGTYATIVEPDEVVVRKNSFAKSFERTGAKVEGKRIAIIDDLEVATVWNEGFVKTLTSKELRARAEYEHSRAVPNRCKFHLGLNVAPEPEAENEGIVRRLCIIPYGQTFRPDGAKEQELSAMIEAECGGILAWAVDGFRRYRARGRLEYPAETVAASAAYRREHFKVEGVVMEIFEKPGEGEVGEWLPMEKLMESLQDYMREKTGAEVAVSAEKLGSILKQQLGVISKKVFNKEKNNMKRSYLIKQKFNRQNVKSI